MSLTPINPQAQALVVGLNKAKFEQWASFKTEAELGKTPKESIQERPGKGGQIFSYVDVIYVMRKLDEAYGPFWNVDTELPEGWLTAASKGQLVVKVTITVRNPDGTETRRSQFGSDTIQMSNTGQPAKELGDSVKAAASDGLKKAASLFGVARDVYAGEI